MNVYTSTMFQRKSLKCISHASNVLIEWSWWKKSVLCAPFFFLSAKLWPSLERRNLFYMFFLSKWIDFYDKIHGFKLQRGSKTIHRLDVDWWYAKGSFLVWAPESFRFAEAYINYITNPAGFFPGNDDFVDNRTNPKRTKGETQTPLARGSDNRQAHQGGIRFRCGTVDESM